MLDAKERPEQLAVQDGGPHCERSGVTAVQCPGRGAVAGPAGRWLFGPDSLPRLRASRKENRFHPITAIPLYPGQLCETDETVTG